VFLHSGGFVQVGENDVFERSRGENQASFRRESATPVCRLAMASRGKPWIERCVGLSGAGTWREFFPSLTGVSIESLAARPDRRPRATGTSISVQEPTTSTATLTIRADLPRRTPLRILIADTHDDTADAFASHLHQEGHTVVCARTCGDLFRQVDADQFDLLIFCPNYCDDNGWEALAEQRIPQRIVVISMSADHKGEEEAMSKSIGCALHLTKPFEAEVLDRAIEQAMAARKTAGLDHEGGGHLRERGRSSCAD
jgi:CheY-like chemotaxis protein